MHAQAGGPAVAQPVLASLPRILQCTSGPSAATRSAALASVAAAVAALGSSLVPAVPLLLPAIMSAASAVARHLPDSTATDTAFDAAAEVDQHEFDKEELETEQQAPTALVLDALTSPQTSKRKRKTPHHSTSQGAGVSEAAAALATVQALLGSPLGAYLTPRQLPELLAALLSQRLLGCSAPAVAGPRERVQMQVPSVVPARLLLPALIAHLSPALEVGLVRSCMWCIQIIV